MTVPVGQKLKDVSHQPADPEQPAAIEESDFAEIQSPGRATAIQSKEQRVVVHMASQEIVKGYIRCTADANGGPRQLQCATDSDSYLVRLLNRQEFVRITTADIKAIFFVKSHHGDATRKGIRFYAHGPELGRIWVEIRFKDGERLECNIDNSPDHLLNDGFWAYPTDAGGNNLMIYVSKRAIESYRVLGVMAASEPAERGKL